MAFDSIRFFCFRNLEDQKVEVDSPVVFLIGDNGQGKTNFIESIYLLCYGSSFRTPRTARMIRDGRETALVEGSFSENGKSDFRNVSVMLRAGKRSQFRLDSTVLAHRGELLGVNPCVVFCHGDMEFVNGVLERKRWFFNQTISLFDVVYMDTWRRYRKVLRNRNASLREGRDSLLDSYDVQLARMGWIIQEKRCGVIEDFNRTFQPLFRSLFEGRSPELEITYRPSWRSSRSEDDCLVQLKERRARDRERGLTSSGPHRDAILYLSDGKDFSESASTGQIRLLSLALKTAQAVYFEMRTDRKPVLLLDDVLLELDGGRRAAFLNNLPAYEQAFFTFLPDEKFLNYAVKGTLMRAVRNGRIAQWTEPATS